MVAEASNSDCLPSSSDSLINLIDGKETAITIRNEVKERVAVLLKTHEQRPKLAVVLVGDRRDSLTYVGMKEKACQECGIDSEVIRLETSVTQEELEMKLEFLNASEEVDGILLQLPLPSHICEREVLEKISWRKDVDGLHPMNVGNLALRNHTPKFRPCTAEGVVELCRRYGVVLEGAEVVVLGRSNLVGMPVSLLLQQENATVTMCHSKTKNIEEHCRRADIIVAAIGKPKFVKGEWLKIGAVVIDVGINAVDDPTAKKGYRLVGDVDFDSCRHKCKLITPVPGGVGPMTVAILMKNAMNSRMERIQNICK